MMTLKEIMTPEPIAAESETSLQEVATLMRNCDIGCVPILDNGALVGLITDRDLVLKGVAEGLDLKTHHANEIMSTNLNVASEDMGATAAAQLMTINKVRRLPVVDNNKLVGMVSLGDIIVSTQDVITCGHVLEEVSTPRGPKCVM